MYEAMATVVGTLVTNPVTRDLSNGERVLTFRMASNSRRFDIATGDWVDNGTLFLTVTCWRRLVGGVDASLRRGDPVLVYGQLRTHEYRTKEGVDRRDLEMRASAVGPDLTRCTTEVRKRGGEQPAGNAEVRNNGGVLGAAQPVRGGEGVVAAVEATGSVPVRSVAPETVSA